MLPSISPSEKSQFIILHLVTPNPVYRHIRVDCGTAAALRQRLFPPNKMISNALSYDADCIYRPHLLTRLSNNHPDVVHMLDNELSAFIIPAVHIRNHKEACWYMYGGAYTPCIGHFFGETAEMIWPFMNRFVGQIRQMTNGHRQDTIIRNLGAWNWCKVQRIGISFERQQLDHYQLICSVTASQLSKDLQEAIVLYEEKRNHLRALCKTHASELTSWLPLSRRPQQDGGKVKSVYKHEDVDSKFFFYIPSPHFSVSCS